MLSLTVAMEPGSQAGILQEILDRLCRESDPRKIYKDLKELSSVPVLCDSLAEIGFRKTIRSLKKQQLLVPFVKDLVAKWSPGLLPGPQPEQVPQDFGLVRSPRTAQQSTSLEETSQEQVFQVSRVAGREVFLGLSNYRPGTISCLNASHKSNTGSHPQAPHLRSLDPGENWSSKQQLAVQNPGQVGTHSESFEVPWQPEGGKTLSREPGAGSGKPKGLVFGGHRKIAHQAAGSGLGGNPLGLVQCGTASLMNADLLLQVPAACKRKREPPWPAEAQRPRAKIPRGDSPRSKDQSPIADCASPESHCTGQACLEVDLVPEPSCSRQTQEASPWGWELRKYQKTPVHSGRPSAPGGRHQSHPGLLGKDPAGLRHATHCPSAKEEAEPGQPEEKTQSKMPISEQTQSRPGSSTPLCLQQSQEERLQALIARIESTRAKSLQARQTKMVSFHTQHKIPGRQGEPGPRGVPSAPTSYSLPETPAHPGAKKSSCLPTRAKGSKKAPAKRPAPLMAKALRDYSRRFYTN